MENKCTERILESCSQEELGCGSGRGGKVTSHPYRTHHPLFWWLAHLNTRAIHLSWPIISHLMGYTLGKAVIQ